MKTNKLNIVYEDEHLFIINKNNGLLTEHTKYQKSNTLLDYVKEYFVLRGISFNEEDRWGICHRLDRDTSGLIIVAKSKKIKEEIISLFIEKKIIKKYYAILSRNLKSKSVTVETFLERVNKTTKQKVSKKNGNKEKAVTIFKEIKKYENFSLVECEIKTGQTHQIRAHAKFINNPIVNDNIYNKKKDNLDKFIFLCAYFLSFDHPVLKNKKIEVEIKLPNYFKEYIKLNK